MIFWIYTSEFYTLRHIVGGQLLMTLFYLINTSKNPIKEQLLHFRVLWVLHFIWYLIRIYYAFIDLESTNDELSLPFDWHVLHLAVALPRPWRQVAPMSKESHLFLVSFYPIILMINNLYNLTNLQITNLNEQKLKMTKLLICFWV